MTDIGTIREALEKSALSYLFTSDLRESALSALERVSAECQRLQKWGAVCRVQFEKANMAADRFQKESMALRKDLERVSAGDGGGSGKAKDPNTWMESKEAHKSTYDKC